MILTHYTQFHHNTVGQIHFMEKAYKHGKMIAPLENLYI